MVISTEDHRRVSEAIASAEQDTSGEILAIVAERSDAYHDVGLHYAVLVAFLALGAVALWPGLLNFWWTMLFGWELPTARGLMTLLFGVVLFKFVATLLIMKWKPLRVVLTPASTKTRRVRQRAVTLFRVGAERRTVGRTGVLIYLSIAERRAEIVGDEAIIDRSEPDQWASAMDALITRVRAGQPADGMIDAITMLGAILSVEFPRGEHDVNEIPDKLIEL